MLAPGGILILDDVRWQTADMKSHLHWDDRCSGVKDQKEVYVMHAIQAVLGSVAGGADVLLCNAEVSPQAAFKKRTEVFKMKPHSVSLEK